MHPRVPGCSPALEVLVKGLREEFRLPILLNADHTHSLEKAIEAPKAAFDAIVFDPSVLPFEQMFGKPELPSRRSKGINPNVLVEGDICDIGARSEIHTQAQIRVAVHIHLLSTLDQGRTMVIHRRRSLRGSVSSI